MPMQPSGKRKTSAKSPPTSEKGTKRNAISTDSWQGRVAGSSERWMIFASCICSSQVGQRANATFTESNSTTRTSSDIPDTVLVVRSAEHRFCISALDLHLSRVPQHLHAMPQIQIPSPLRQYSGKQASIHVPGKTVGEALAGLVAQHPDLKRHLYTEDGKLRTFVNVYVNDEDMRYLEKEATVLKDGDTISIVPSIAGGCCVMTCGA